MCSLRLRTFFSQWRLWIRPLLIALYVILVIVLVPILIAHSINNGFKKSDQGSLVAGGFVLLALPISIWQITQHVVHYTKPFLQKHIIRYVLLIFGQMFHNRYFGLCHNSLNCNWLLNKYLYLAIFYNNTLF